MQIEIFNNQEICFDFDKEIVNATDMLKSFPGKRINDFLRLKQTKDFINVLESKLDAGIPVTLVKQGGLEQGTWMHKLLALKFASWLDPEFELFVYQAFDKYMFGVIKKRDEEVKKAKEEVRSAQIMEGYAWSQSDRHDTYK